MSTSKKSYSDKLRDPRWQKKRLTILERDKFTCQLCGDTATELQIHHLSYSQTGNPWDVPDTDLITYCCHCHAAIESFKDYKGIRILNATKI